MGYVWAKLHNHENRMPCRYRCDWQVPLLPSWETVQSRHIQRSTAVVNMHKEPYTTPLSLLLKAFHIKSNSTYQENRKLGSWWLINVIRCAPPLCGGTSTRTGWPSKRNITSEHGITTAEKHGSIRVTTNQAYPKTPREVWPRWRKESEPPFSALL